MLGLLSLLSAVLGNQVIEFLLYACFLLLATGVFFLLSRNYVYRKQAVQAEMMPLAEVDETKSMELEVEVVQN